MKYVLLKSFVKKFDSYQKKEQESIVHAVEQIKVYLETGKASFGLRIKKLSDKIFEARINIHLRIVYFRQKDVVKFFGLGTHDDIKQCLKKIKRKTSPSSGPVMIRKKRR